MCTFIMGKYIVSLLPTGFGKRQKIYQFVVLGRSRKYSYPIVVSADWLNVEWFQNEPKTTPIGIQRMETIQLGQTLPTHKVNLGLVIPD